MIVLDEATEIAIDMQKHGVVMSRNIRSEYRRVGVLREEDWRPRYGWGCLGAIAGVSGAGWMKQAILGTLTGCSIPKRR